MAVRVHLAVLKAFRALLGLPFDPVVAGSLLWALTRGPESLRARILDVAGKLPGSLDADKLVRVLKVTLALGLAGRFNAYFNKLAQNAYMIRAPTAGWQWNKQVAVVTGGCAGIGQCFVQGLLRKGVKVVILDVSPLPASLKDWADVYYYQCDVSDPSAVFATAADIEARHGTVSLLFNNAGIGSASALVDSKPEAVQKIFGVNILSHFYTVKAFLPGMVAQKRGHIVTIASTATFVSLPGLAAYAGTKAATLSFHEVLTSEIKHKHRTPGVLTTVVHPNWTRTAIIAKEADSIEAAQGPLMTPEFVADEALKQVFACRGGQLILPAHLATLSTLRAWPNWLQQGLRDALGRQAVESNQF